MKIRIAAICDLHAGEKSALTHRRGDIADVLLLRAVHQINRWIKPDITLLLGDVVADGQDPSAREDMQKLRDITELLQSPTIVIPGNHDGQIETFYSFFKPPAGQMDIKGFRFVTFWDPEKADFSTSRSKAEIDRLKAARTGHDGPIISLQHVPIFPPGKSECPYNFANATEIISVIKNCGCFLALSGHYHKGMELIKDEGINFLAGPALCESPFYFLQIDTDGRDIEVTKHQLAMPAELELVDCHIHTQLAYCSENMDAAKTVLLAEDFGLAGMGFSEHSNQLYFDEQNFQKWRWTREGIALAPPEYNRIDEYFALASGAGCKANCIGFEANCDFSGKLVLKDADRERAGFLIGAIHRLQECQNPQPDYGRAVDKYLPRLKKLLETGITTLAHPMRAFQRSGLPRDEKLFAPVVRMLREAGVAAEINFHTQEPQPEFVRLCLQVGVKFTFGSDSHNLYEIGLFTPHIQLLRDCGYNGDLADVLIDPRKQG